MKTKKHKDAHDFHYENITNPDERLDAFLKYCIDLYWDKVERGEWPWIDEQGEDITF